MQPSEEILSVQLCIAQKKCVPLLLCLLLLGQPSISSGDQHTAGRYTENESVLGGDGTPQGTSCTRSTYFLLKALWEREKSKELH